jgi:hypothetical protein
MRNDVSKRNRVPVKNRNGYLPEQPEKPIIQATEQASHVNPTGGKGRAMAVNSALTIQTMLDGGLELQTMVGWIGKV